MVFVTPIILLTISYIIGSLPMKLLAPDVKCPGERSLVGTLFMFILWECLMLPGIKLFISFELLCRFYAGLLLILVIVSMIVCRQELVKNLVFNKLHLIIPLLFMLAVFVAQCAYILSVPPDITLDYTVETVNTTLVSDKIYENNPYMGDLFTYGITFRGKVVSLPLFYAFLCRTTGLKATIVVYQIVPIWCLALSMIAFRLLGDALFPEEDKHPVYFAVGIGILNLFGAFSRQSIFFYRMRKGYAGENFIVSVFVPLLLYAVIRLGAKREKKNILVIALLLLASIPVADFTKGLMSLGISLLVGFGIIAIYHVRRNIHAKRG